MTRFEIKEMHDAITHSGLWVIHIYDEYMEVRFLDDDKDDRLYKVYPNDICPECGKIRIY